MCNHGRRRVSVLDRCTRPDALSQLQRRFWRIDLPRPAASAVLNQLQDRNDLVRQQCAEALVRSASSRASAPVAVKRLVFRTTIADLAAASVLNTSDAWEAVDQ